MSLNIGLDNIMEFVYGLKAFFFKRDKNPLGHKALPSSRICKSFVVQQFTATMLFQPAFKYTV